jgi:AcrR family transcriptional regulator
MNQTRSESAPLRDRILDVAERLYAEQGLNAVSLRQISAAAGARNTNAVQYHFGSAEGLIRAILERYAPELEMKRARLLADYAGRGKLDAAALLQVLYRPLLDDDGSGEAPVFARFFLTLLAARNGWEPLVDVFQRLPVSRQVFALITEANKPVPGPITWQRILYGGIALLTYAVNASSLAQSRQYYEAAVTDAFVMAAAGLAAPVEADAALLVAELEMIFAATRQKYDLTD